MDFEAIKESADFISAKTKLKPEVGIILGSGLNNSLKLDRVETSLAYKDIPNFPKPSVEGHRGLLEIGSIGKRDVAVLRGRCHYYEGYDLSEITLPIRVLKLLGIDAVITAGAGASTRYNIVHGDIAVLIDHLNLIGENPLRGKNIDEIGTRFPDMTNVYDKELSALTKEACDELGIPFKTAIYAAVAGPSYETPAEIAMLRTLGADVVGMSIVPEAITAVHAGMRVEGLVVITNLAAGMGKLVSHDEVLKVSSEISPKVNDLLRKVIAKI